MQPSSSRLLSLLGVLILGSVLGGGYAPKALATATAHEALDSFGASTAPDEITPEIAALTQGVINSPAQIPSWQKCYLYVLQNVQYEHYYGCKKGAHLTYLDGKGNDADQATLLVAMLRAAGYQAQYQTGVRALLVNATNEGVSANSWLGVSANQIVNYTITRNFNSNLYTDGTAPNNYADATYFGMPMCWVQVNVGGTWTSLQPAIKNRTRIDPLLNIPTAAHYSLAALKTAAGGTTGTTVSVGGVSKPANWVSGISENGVNNYLDTCATTLQGSLNTNQAQYAVNMTGGWSQSPGTDANGNAYLFYGIPLTGVPADVTYTSLPSSMLSQLTMTVTSTASGNPTVITKTIPLSQLEGRRLSLTFNASNQAQLMLDDTVLASENSASVGTTVGFNVTITHPTSSGAASQQDTFYSKTYNRGSTYVESYAFNPSPNLLYKRQKVLSEYLMAGLSNTSPQVLGETLNVIGLQHMNETELAYKAISASNNCDPMFFHRFGTVGQDKGYFIDLPAQYFGMYSMDGTKNAFNLTAACAYVMSSMEHAAIEQLQGTSRPAVSTARLLTLANRNGTKIFLADSATWTNVQTQLTGYAAADAASINATITGAIPGTAVVPANGLLTVNSWKGAGYLNMAVDSTGKSFGMMISGNLNGGFSSVDLSDLATPKAYGNIGTTVPAALNPPVVSVQAPPASTGNTASAPVTTNFVMANPNAQTVNIPSSPSKPPVVRSDPIEMTTGSYYVPATTDISLGRSAPRGLAFARSYLGSQASTNPTGLGYGWTHNWNVRATNRCAYEPSLGLNGTPLDMAGILVTSQALVDLMNDTPSAKDYTVSALVSNWLTDNLQNNALSISLGARQLQFVRRVDGVWQAPGGITSTVTVNSDSSVTLTERNSNVYKFDTAGRLTTMTDVFGKAATVAYADATPAAKVTSVTDAYGRKLTFTYAADGTLASVGDGTRSATYAYDAATKDLLKATDPESTYEQYTYDAGHRILQVSNQDGGILGVNTYDILGRVATQLNQGLVARTWSYYYTPYTGIEVSPVGGNITSVFDDRHRQIAETTLVSSATQSSPGIYTSFTPVALLTSTMAYDGQDHVVQAVSPTGRTVSYTYDLNHNVLTTTDPLGQVTTNTYDSLNRLATTADALNNTTRFTYNTKHQVLTVTRPDGTVTTNTYNTAGTLATTKDPANNTTSFTYDTLNRLTKTTAPNSTNVSLVLNTLDDPVSVTDARGNVTTTAYNNRREVVSVTAPGNLTTSTIYNNERQVASVTDANGNVTAFTYSPTNKLLTTTLPDSSVLSNTYDVADRLVASTDPLGNVSSVSYYSNNWVASTTDALGNTTGKSLDLEGETTAVNDPLGLTSQAAYDLRGQVTQTTDPLNQISSNVYDALGRRTTFTDRRSNSTTFAYDTMSRLLSTTTPEGKVNSRTYNTRGLLATATQPSGKVSTVTYDTLGRKLSVKNATTSAGTVYNQYANTYDNNSNALTTKKTTNTSPTTPVSSFTRAYDALDRVTQFSSLAPVGGVAYTLNYTYDSNGNLATLTYEAGKTVTYAYDNRNRLTSVTDWLGKVTNFTYDNDGRMLTLARPNGSTLTQTYDANGNLLTRTDAFAAGTISALGLTYDADNRVISRQMYPPMQPAKPDSLTPHTSTFTADNKISQLTGTSMQFPAYDADENLTSAPSASSLLFNSGYAYDADNKLVSTTNPDATTATYAYDAEGNRISVASTQAGAGNGTTQFVVDPQASLPRILWRIRPNGTRTFYVYGGGLLYEIEEQTSTARYYHFDSRGSTVAITEANGNVSARGSYSTYGAPTSQLGNWDTPFQWCGAGGVVTDPNGLISMRARFYHPGLGRFMNRDPLGLAAGPNCFAYCNGNPVMGWDPSGLCMTSAPSFSLWKWAWTGYGHMDDQAFDNVMGNAAASGSTQVAHAGLGLASFVPGPGTLAAGTDAAIYKAEGDNVNAALSAAAMIPGEKIVAALGKGAMAVRGAQVARAVEEGAMEEGALSKAIKGFCFTPGTLVLTASGEKEIESLSVGQRVMTTVDDAGTAQDHNVDTKVDAATWKEVVLSMPNPTCAEDILIIHCLRSPEWIATTKSTVGQDIQFGLPEMGLHGQAHVDAIKPCPVLETGSGREVLATVTHQNTEVLKLWLKGSAKALGPTATHRLYSADRQAWVPAGELRVGEKLKTASGTIAIVGIEKLAGVHQVYNIEVETTHCFYVGAEQVLSHNENPCAAGANESAQMKKLSNGEIRKLDKAGIDPHDLKPNSKYDLFKDKVGDIHVKPKNGAGPGEPTGYNINNL